jgi:hypothetical protein
VSLRPICVYDTYLATGSPAYGTYGFSASRVSTARSHPNDSLFFQAGIPECPKCAVFIGDYNGLDFGPDGTAHAVWTDMRRRVTLEGETGYTQNIFYAQVR